MLTLWDHEHADDISNAFPFQDLDYVPSGFSGVLAPYIETGPGTMRAAVVLMGLDKREALGASSGGRPTVVCDLGCGDGQFLIGLLTHCNNTPLLSSVKGFGVDYDPAFIATANTNALFAGQKSTWLEYDFNADLDDLVSKLSSVTHIFAYLVPKQLALPTVRKILTRLHENGVVVCCHKFQPAYLEASRTDTLMDLVVYQRGSVQA